MNDQIVAKSFLPVRVHSEVLASLDKFDLLGDARETHVHLADNHLLLSAAHEKVLDALTQS